MFGLVAAMFAVLVSVSQAATQVTFAPATNYVVGGNPWSVVAADVNGDAKPDLIYANNDSPVGTLIVLTNDGHGGFVRSSSPSVGDSPWAVVAADVNGDGKLDLICANYGADTLSVLTNNGSGHFVLAATLGVGHWPMSVVAADVNGDGKLDLISANSGANTLSVWTNNGHGGFGSNATLKANSQPYSVVAADVNGDGKLDLICANYGTNKLSVLTNNGSGGFTLASSPGVGTRPYSVVAADVNGDGKVDLISANFDYGSGNTLSVLTNNGSGGFLLAATLSVGAGPASVVAADVNGDGKLDLICANYIDSTLSVLTNNGSGGFLLAATLTLSAGSGPYSVAAADLDGDGMVDLISANSSGGSLSVLINTSALQALAPTLTITRSSGNSVIVSWPSSVAGWTLQTNSNLSPGSWGSYAGAAINNTVTNSPATGDLFFRLTHP